MVDGDAGPILVVGMHRSGTSMVAGVLARLVDDPIEPRRQPTNPYGQYERVDLRPHLDGLLLTKRATWRHPPAEPDAWADSSAANAIARRAVRRLGPGDRVWKDPRLCLTLPVWLRHLPRARLVYVLRDPAQVAVSLHERDATPLSTGAALWSYYVRSSIQASPAEVFVVSHRRVVEDPSDFVASLATWLGIDDERRRCAGVMSIASSAAHSSPNERPILPSATEELWSRIEDWNGPLAIDSTVVDELPPAPHLRSATLAELAVSVARVARRLIVSPDVRQAANQRAVSR